MIWQIVKRLAVAGVILFYLVLIISFVSVESRKLVCSKLDIHICDSALNRFITRGDVVSLMETHGIKSLGYPVEQINTLIIEQLIREFPPVASVEAYCTVDGILIIDVVQRRPVIRIICNNGQSYYIDYNGKILPLSHKYTSHVPVVNGFIPANIPVINNTSVIPADTLKKNRTQLYDLYRMGRYIYDDPFLSSQIQQIYVYPGGMMDMLPRIGNHVISFGHVDDMEYKFEKLKTFYSKALSAVGWNEYKKIDVKFSNQIVCTKN